MLINRGPLFAECVINAYILQLCVCSRPWNTLGLLQTEIKLDPAA